MMYSVRIDKDGDGYVFRVQPCKPVMLEMVAIDSAPGIIATVNAADPSHACLRAWAKAQQMRDSQPQQVTSRDVGEFLAGLPKP